ncbi:MAG: sigma-70 family RNA polymerase sigma factor [Lentihominibacter sp.]|nr:sigma-70 family RNA polymerase sigma factor [Clostridiales bacterium]MDY2680442.1 sigma-70 family RNA polymerase sigma factor [Lentihominibacter sp.]
MEIRELQLLPDDKLAALAQSGNLDAEEALLKKYKDAVRIKANMYYMAGADEDDVMQEGMIGLMKAIRQYSPEREASFGTFAGICITRQIISAIRSADRDKHKALNTSVSLSRPLETGNEEVTLADTLSSGTGESPEEMLIFKDIVYYILHNGDNIFSEFEMNVLSEFIKGNDYEKIADKLGKNVKSVDNAMQRTRKKILGYLFK